MTMCGKNVSASATIEQRVAQWTEFLHSSEKTVHLSDHLSSLYDVPPHEFRKMYSIDISGQAIHISPLSCNVPQLRFESILRRGAGYALSRKKCAWCS